MWKEMQVAQYLLGPQYLLTHYDSIYQGTNTLFAIVICSPVVFISCTIIGEEFFNINRILKWILENCQLTNIYHKQIYGIVFESHSYSSNGLVPDD